MTLLSPGKPSERRYASIEDERLMLSADEKIEELASLLDIKDQNIISLQEKIKRLQLSSGGDSGGSSGQADHL